MVRLKRRKRERANIRAETRVRWPAHLQFVRLHVCALQNIRCAGKVEAAHIRMGTDGGIGVKPSDNYAVPLCNFHHRTQHNLGEAAFWEAAGIDPLKLAAQLWQSSPARPRYEQRQRART